MNKVWLDAEADCEADALGAHLAVIDDAAEAAIVDKYRPDPTDFAWIGGTDVVNEGTFVSVTGGAASYVVWAAAEPDGAVDDCLLLRQNLTLGDADCGAGDDYICEYDGIPAVSAVWGVCPTGYTFSMTGCYRFVDGATSSALTWLQAETDCEDDVPGAHQVILDSMAEAMAVDNFVPNLILDHFIGVTDVVSEGTLLTVANQPAVFTTFAPGQPDGGATENCMRLTDSVQLEDVRCDTQEDYVCEYDGITPVPAAWGQ